MYPNGIVRIMPSLGSLSQPFLYPFSGSGGVGSIQ